MLAAKKGESTSLYRYSNVIYVLSAVIICCLLSNACNVNCSTAPTATEAEPIFAPEHIERSCIEKCPDQNQNTSNSAECVEQCGQNQCAAGCRLWETALDTSCKVACNTTDQNVEDWFCVMGCNNAISQYFEWLRDEIGTPPAPALLADSLTSTSLSLEWEIPDHLSTIMKRRKNVLRNYLVQWRYEEIGNDWKYYRNQSMEDSTTIFVDNLQPYTKYRFRVALILSSFREIELYSEQSLVILTAEEGPPQSEPDIVRAVAVDHTRISISWEPGLLKNGPILFYVLQIKETDRDTYFAIKDIPYEQQEILIENLKPSTKYTVEVQMRNKAGIGPAAAITVTTTEKPEVRHDDETLKLIIVSSNQILMQGPQYFYEQPNFIYNSSEVITGIGIHVAKKLLFITDESRAIYKAPLNHSALKLRERIYSTEGTNQIPLALSVDWLNNKLYILFESYSMNQKGWQISRCNFDGSQLQVVYSGLQSKPAHFQVDPFNGYLFWSLNAEIKTDGGLFRLDLSDVSNGVKHEIEPTLIFNRFDIGVFVIDYVHYKILVPIQELNTVVAMDLNGDKFADIRNNTQTPMFATVKSFAMANELFYWSSGPALMMEEYHEVIKYYYVHNFKKFAGLDDFQFICVKLPSAQPTPKPLNPSSNVQALLGIDRAKVSWRIPHLLGIQGRGAWQDWTYELEIIDEDQNDTKRIESQIKALHYTVSDLSPDTRYRFRVAAYTSAGYSPYSVEFRGQTLKLPHNRQIIWASHDGLIQSDILGDNIHTLIAQQKLDCNITNLEWFEDVLYFVCNYSLYSFNRTTNITEKLNVRDAVQAIAVDWIGRRLYWFNPLHQMITRGSIANFEPEVLFPLSALETDIKIDSLRGFLYFSTGHSVEFCRLNCKDKDKKEFYRMEAYSGKKVMGLTLDFDSDRVYWIVRSYDGSTLISAPMIDDEMNLFELAEHSLPEKQVLGPLAYLSNRLLWLQDDRTVVIGNLTGRNLANIKSIELSDLKVFAVIDSTQRVLPELDEPLNVIPEPVNASTVQVTGEWNFFTVSWQPVQSVTYGTVFYEVRYLNHSSVDTRPFIEIDAKLPPYSQLNISIKALTYWATSATVKGQVNSPPAPPSPPLRPRFFMTHMHDPMHGGLNVDAIFRWTEPKSMNGPLTGYKIFCWHEKNNNRHEMFIDYHLQPEINEKEMENVPKNATIFCKVKAVTIAGEGSYSPLVSMSTLIEKPLPRLFAASNEVIYGVDFDLDKKRMIVNAKNRVDHMCYIALSKQLFWTNENNELMSYSRNGKQKLLSINAPVLSITVDWIERILYWSQRDTKGSSINAFNLNTRKSNFLLRSQSFINNLNVAPLNRELYWIESELEISTRGTLVSHRFGAENSSIFRDSKNATVLVTQNILFLDTFNEGHEKILWLNEYSQLMSTDIRTRVSRRANFVYQPNTWNLVRDSGRMYWTQGDLLFAENPPEQIPFQRKLFRPTKILPMFRQNYPSLHCLLPRRHFDRRSVTLYDSTDRSLWLHLPAPKRNENCSFEPMQLKYRIMYAEMIVDGIRTCNADTCNIIETYDKVIEIAHLKPITKYQFQISISNYYMDELNMTTNFTRTIIFQTKTGTPSRPRNVSATILSPTEINVKWLPPLEINGVGVKYEVHYQTENEINGVKNQLQLLIKDENVTSINITSLLPNQPYNVWVRAYTTETLHNQSLPLKIVTLPDPANIQFVSATSKTLEIEWQPYAHALSYIMACRPIGYDDSNAEVILDSSNQINSSNVERNGNVLKILNLHPKTQYTFWLSFWFENRTEPYTWPRDERYAFTYETHADRPNAPGKPSINHLRSDVYQVTWASAEGNGAPIEVYSLEGLRYRGLNRSARSTDSTNITGDQYNDTTLVTNTLTNVPLTVEDSESNGDKWTEYYLGNETYWIIKALDEPIAMYSFRVRARNAYGWSNYSALSDRITEIYTLGEHREYLVIAVAAPAFVSILIITFSCIVCAFRRKTSDKKNFQDSTTGRIDVELATLQHLPRNGTFVQSTNILYSFGPITDCDIALLPQIRREQITIANFLGSGAFGEVYEGFVRNVGDEPETRVAIKTLRKGATEQEKGEFLQEAQLMSNFKHKHILSLIGVCFDADALYIIMELMQGGDLLSFLRQSRPCDGMTSALTLLDLTTMCVDIASGCRYLEEMHFVHRDLACRNCLVSSVDPENRVVKIGDFGLARDIYKNDYYRKDGEGLLPVRWMSPESLVDGVFTSQSDIWAFGVLCWEIMTLGQQPYPARTNVEVLHYVRDGGRLDKPSTCPDDLYQLMTKCWSYRPEERPTFRYCLDVLQSLRNQFDDIRINMENANRNFAGGIFNRSYLLADENHNHAKDVVKYVNAPIIAASETYSIPKSTSTTIPKYLEIIYDENDDRPVQVNPYEIPLPPLDEMENVVHKSSPVPSLKSVHKSIECDTLRPNENGNSNCTKGRTISSASTVSESSVLSPPKTNTQPNTSSTVKASDVPADNCILTVTLPNAKEDCTSNEKLLLPQQQQQPPYAHDISKRKIQQMYANTNIECAIRTCDGITSM